jgi:hypothetical protein
MYTNFLFQIDVPEMVVLIVTSVLLTLLFDLPFQNMRKIMQETKSAG